jgi:hypothetical protein
MKPSAVASAIEDSRFFVRALLLADQLVHAHDGADVAARGF